jgi:REP element-mobilizing transposase RayT
MRHPEASAPGSPGLEGALMDRYWLLTWTTYGTWLPGDSRGFVSNVRDGPGPEVRHNIPGTPCDGDLPGLETSARKSLKSPPIYLTREQAGLLLAQFRETATYRGWRLLAVAIMANHVHIVVGVPGDPDPETLLRDFKSYGSRTLNRHCGTPASGTWWTTSGSKRKLPHDEAVRSANDYVVRRQSNPLLVWEATEQGEPGASQGEPGASAPGLQEPLSGG